MKILFYADWPLSWPYLDPIYEYIKEKHSDWELEKSGIRYKSSEEYDYIFVTDEESHCPAKGTYVNLNHGLASKGHVWSTTRKDTYLNYPGFIVCPSEYYKKLLTDMGVSEDKLIVGGLTKFDNIGRIPKLRPIPKVLFAPTHNPELSAIAVLKDKIYEIPGVKVHLHQYTRERSDAPQIYQKYSSGDITEKILDSDIVIGDFGSTVLEGMALGKFVIQVRSPECMKWYLGKENVPKDEVGALPEWYFPSEGGARCVGDMAGVHKMIEHYPHLNERETIVEHIGHASEVIYEHLFG